MALKEKRYLHTVHVVQTSLVEMEACVSVFFFFTSLNIFFFSDNTRQTSLFLTLEKKTPRWITAVQLTSHLGRSTFVF